MMKNQRSASTDGRKKVATIFHKGPTAVFVVDTSIEVSHLSTTDDDTIVLFCREGRKRLFVLYMAF